MDPSKNELESAVKTDSVGDSDRETIFSVSKILRKLANDHQSNILLRENAVLRQEIEQMRIQLSELRMENLRLKTDEFEEQHKTETQSIVAVLKDKLKPSKKSKKDKTGTKSEKSNAGKDFSEQKLEITKIKSEMPSPSNDGVVENVENIENTEFKPQPADDTAETVEVFETNKLEKKKSLSVTFQDPVESVVEIKSQLPIVAAHTTILSDKTNITKTEQDFKKFLIQNIESFLHFHAQKITVNFKMFECIFSCFLNDAEFMQAMKNFDNQLRVILNNRFQFLYQDHILMMNQRIQQVEQQRRQKLFEHFRTGMQMENWARRLKMELSAMRLISELRNAVLKLPAKKDRNAVLQVIQNIENKIKNCRET